MPKKRNQNNELKREWTQYNRKTIPMACALSEYDDLKALKDNSGRTWLENLKLGLRTRGKGK